ncbi:hypothetical protein Ancab_040189 [Ancistrocladus abbreviatus]
MSNYLDKIVSSLACFSFLIFLDGFLRFYSFELPPLKPLYFCLTCLFFLNWGNTFKNTNHVVVHGRVTEPSDFKFEIENYRELLNSAERTGSHRIVSSEFKAGGHSWALVMYPNGKENDNGSGYVSLYLKLVDKPTEGGAVFASFTFFIFNKIDETYVIISTNRERRFDAAHFEWGIPQALHIEYFHDESNGLLVNNSCTIGAEVYVITTTATVARLSLLPKRTHRNQVWPIKNFSELGTEEYSPSFTVEGFSWKLNLFPSGNQTGTGRYLSLYLELENHVDLPGGSKLYVECALSIRDRLSGKDHKKTFGSWFDSNNYWRGFNKFLPLAKLNNPNNGYMDEDAVFIEANLNEVFTLREIK